MYDGVPAKALKDYYLDISKDNSENKYKEAIEAQVDYWSDMLNKHPEYEKQPVSMDATEEGYEEVLDRRYQQLEIVFKEAKTMLSIYESIGEDNSQLNREKALRSLCKSIELYRIIHKMIHPTDASIDFLVSTLKEGRNSSSSPYTQFI